MHVSELDQSQQGIAGRLQREQSVVPVGPVAGTWRTEREEVNEKSDIVEFPLQELSPGARNL